MARLFIAIETRLAVAASLLATLPAQRGIRPVPPGQLHLTLRFLGEQEDAAAPRIAQVLERVAPRAVSLAVQGTGRFRGKQGAILWAGLAPNEPLQRLYEDVQTVLASVGIAPDTRQFRPHLTLARCGPAVPEAVLRDWLARTHALSVPPWKVDRLVLFESQLGPHGAHHMVRTSYSLRPTGPAVA